MRITGRLAVIALALVLAACDPSDSSTSTPSQTPTPPPAAIAGQGTPAAMALPWPDGVSQTWTGGPHGYWHDSADKGSDCLPADDCAKDVPTDVRSGLDFGARDAKGVIHDWDVYPVAAGTLLYKGPFKASDGFGAGAVIQHGDLFVVYAHMSAGSLSAAPEPGKSVTRTTKLGSTWCTGMDTCTDTTGAHHLHLELRKDTVATKDGVTAWGTRVSWDGQTIGGWAIRTPAGALNYNGTATACGKSVIASAAGGPLLVDATDCSALAAGPMPTPTPTPAPVLSGTWVAPKDGQKVTAYSVKLSARPLVSGDSTVDRVVFEATWSGGNTVACTAGKPNANGDWACTANLLQGEVPPGKVAFTFDVEDAAGNVGKAPDGEHSVTYAVPPPKPSDASYTFVKSTAQEGGSEEVYRVKWSAPAGYASEFRIYTVTGCYAKAKGDPCVRPGLKFRDGELAEVGRVDGDKRAFTYSYTLGGVYDWKYAVKAVLVQARNKFGLSKSAIAWTVVCDADTPCP